MDASRSPGPPWPELSHAYIRVCCSAPMPFLRKASISLGNCVQVMKLLKNQLNWDSNDFAIEFEWEIWIVVSTKFSYVIFFRDTWQFLTINLSIGNVTQTSW